MESMIHNALSLMHARYAEDLTLDDLAEAAIMSKFHFIRIFRDALGVTPCRYLSAVRLHEAKRLLRSTRMNVSDISTRVGYSSTGSFTRRFTDSVGYSPIQYRNRAVYGGGVVVPGLRGGDPRGDADPGDTPSGIVWGSVRAPYDVQELFVGVFENPILERTPIACRLLQRPGPFRMVVPAGRQWYVHAVAWPVECPAGDPVEKLIEELEGARDPGPWHDENGGLLVASAGPVTVAAGASLRVDLEVGLHGWGQPPVLLALPRTRRGGAARGGARPANSASSLPEDGEEFAGRPGVLAGAVA